MSDSAPPEGTAAAGRALERHREWLYGAVVTALGVAIVATTPFVTRDESSLIPLDNPALRPSFYPRVVGILMAATGVWILVRYAVKRVTAARIEALATMAAPVEVPDSVMADLEPPATWRTPAVVAIMAVYVTVVNLVGFRGATIVFGIGFSRWMGAPWWAAALIGVVPAIGLFAIFVLGLEVPMPADLY